MTTTIELIEWLEEQARLIRGAFENGTTNEWSDKTKEAANRLRELDKPDCGWTNKDLRVDSYITGCNRKEGMRWSLYCPNCGGAVIKEST